MMSCWLFDFVYRGCVLGRQGGFSVQRGVKIDVTADSTLIHIIFLQINKSENVVQIDGGRLFIFFFFFTFSSQFMT